MKKIDFRSMIIGFLLAIVFFLLTGQTKNKTVGSYQIDLEIQQDGRPLSAILDTRTGDVRYK